MLNSRPLSYVSVDDLDEPLTPSHLLSGRRILSLPDHLYCEPDEENFDVEPSTLTRRLMHINKTLDRFWKRTFLVWVSNGYSTYLRLHGGEVFLNGSFNQPRDVSERSLVRRVSLMMSCLPL